ncbi:hypothetical protein EJB05_57373, partial [Eragrostis curvula]
MAQAQTRFWIFLFLARPPTGAGHPFRIDEEEASAAAMADFVQHSEFLQCKALKVSACQSSTEFIVELSMSMAREKRDMENIVDHVLKLHDSELYISEEIEVEMIHELISTIAKKKWHQDISDILGYCCLCNEKTCLEPVSPKLQEVT